MKTLLFTFFVFLSNLSFSQLNNDYKMKRINERNIYITDMVDAFNSMKITKCEKDFLPNFFFEHEYDQKVGGNFNLGLHAYFSMRKAIIDGIMNYPLLYCVISLEDKRLNKTIPIPQNSSYTYVEIPFQKYSTYQLVEFRIEALKNLVNSGEFKYDEDDVVISIDFSDSVAH